MVIFHFHVFVLFGLVVAAPKQGKGVDGAKPLGNGLDSKSLGTLGVPKQTGNVVEPRQIALFAEPARPEINVNAAQPSKDKAESVTYPVCLVGGTSYQPGETWTDHANACVQYTCTDSGQLRTNRTGCMYRGVCKDSSLPWTEDCFRFECASGDNTTSYRLIGAGCKQTNGQCLDVGQRVTSGCDVVECLVEGGQIVSKTIERRCFTDSGCKDLGQYWHDGCTVYTCALENGRAAVQSLPHDRMRWPSGQYALFRPKSGCPDDNVDFWAEGSRKHFGEGRNYFSRPLSLAGSYAPEYMTHEFCVRHLRAEQSPGYMTHWEAGSYCVFRSRGKCPNGFTEGFLMLDDHPGTPATGTGTGRTAAFQRGALPDGEYGSSTGFFFCCRDDGPVTSGIELPVESPFVLLQNSQAGCQTVYGMSSSQQSISFSGAAGPDHFRNGTVPYVLSDGSDVTLNLCYYEPNNDCGCMDKSGQVIEVNTERTIGCVVKRCSPVNGRRVVEIVEGGCKLDNGSCVTEGQQWSVIAPTACTRKSCMRITTGSDVTFEARTLGEGCVKDSSCIAVGSEVTDNCYTSRCELDSRATTPALNPARAGCPWHGTCKAENTTWVDRCTTYRCNVTSKDGRFHRNIAPIEYGCDNGKGGCYKLGENVTDQCYDAVCKMAANQTLVYLDVIKGGCRTKNGCSAVGDTWSDGCHDYRCEWSHSEAGFSSVVNATSVSCQWNGTCYKEGQVWSDGCVDYRCDVTRLHSEVSWKVETHQLACTDFAGKCVPVGENVTDNCVTYQCNHRNNRIGLEPVAAGCQLAERCIAENDTYSDTTRCVDYICQRLARPSGAVMQLSVSQYKCSFNSTCMRENETWEDGCRTRKCVILKTDKSVQRSTAPVQAGCDDEGICRPVGYTKVTDSCTEYECEFKQEYRDAFFTLIGGGCKSSDGKCKHVNVTWEELTSDVCVTYQCHKEAAGYISKVSTQMCRDADGKCQAVGNTGFPSVVKGKFRSNCSCQESEAPIQGVSIRCSG